MLVALRISDEDRFQTPSSVRLTLATLWQQLTRCNLLCAVIPFLWILITPTLLGEDRRSRQEPQRSEIIRLNTSLVTIPVIVRDRSNRLMPGLSRGDFMVWEDGVRQEIVNFSSTEEPFNVALLIDASPSTRYWLNDIRKAALDFVKQLQPKDRVMIVAFDERVHFLGGFTSDRQELAHLIRSVKSSLATALYDAIYRTIKEQLSSLTGRKALVVFTDGVDTYSHQATSASTLELVANSGIPCYAIQYWGGKSGDQFLRSLADESGALHLRAGNIEKTSAAFALIAEELRHQYQLAYYPLNDQRDGRYRVISVSVNQADLTVRARRGYRASKD